MKQMELFWGYIKGGHLLPPASLLLIELPKPNAPGTYATQFNNEGCCNYVHAIASLETR